MNESIKKMYEQEPKTWYAKIIVALIVAALLAWSLSTVQSTGSNGSGLSVAGKIISGIFHPDTGLLFLHPEWHICYWKQCVSHS